MTRKQQKPLKAKVTPDNPFFDIIQDAYRVFRYDTPTDTEVCKGCCMDAEIEEDFFAPAIEEMPLHYLQDWYFAACEPPISKALWGYLLPRVLEVLAVGEDDPASVGLEVSLNRFPTGHRDQWSAAEWDVLDRFQRLFLSEWIVGRKTYLDDMICMFGLAGWPVADLMAQVAAHSDEALCLQFHSDWCIGRPAIWITAFWEGGGNTEAFKFYTSRGLYDRMERLALAPTTDPAVAEMALSVASAIQENADWA